MSLLYNASLPFSTFQRLPDSTTSIDYTIDDLNVQSKTPARYHTRIMTAPTYNSPSTSAASLDYNQVTIDTNFFYPSIISTPALSEPDMFCLPFIDTQTPNDVLYTPISFPINNNNNVTTYMLNTDYFFQQQQQQQQHQDILTATPQFMKHNEQEDHSSNLTYLF